jgi:hypothetical protein
VVEMLLWYYLLDLPLPFWFCRMFYTGGPCVEGTVQEVILFKYFDWLCALSECGCELHWTGIRLSASSTPGWCRHQRNCLIDSFRWHREGMKVYFCKKNFSVKFCSVAWRLHTCVKFFFFCISRP